MPVARPPLARGSARAKASASGPRRVLTGRAIVLGALIVVLLVLLAAPLSRYFGSRGDVGAAATQLQQDRAELAQLKAQQQRWSDPGYIEQQARTRLQYAMPGDTVYVVVHKGSKSQIEKTAGNGADTGTQPGSWNTRLWASVQHAGGRT
jgi:cell division protein FtsB